MSTPTNIHFLNGEHLAANIYRHNDAYPAGLGIDLQLFLDETASLPDSRWDDAEYLASKYLVWQAAQNALAVSKGKKPNPLAFTAVCPCIEDHTDISYRYTVRCDNQGGRPRVFVERVQYHDEQPVCTDLGEVRKLDDGTYTLAGEPLKE